MHLRLNALQSIKVHGRKLREAASPICPVAILLIPRQLAHFRRQEGGVHQLAARGANDQVSLQAASPTQSDVCLEFLYAGEGKA